MTLNDEQEKKPMKGQKTEARHQPHIQLGAGSSFSSFLFCSFFFGHDVHLFLGTHSIGRECDTVEELKSTGTQFLRLAQ